MSKCKILSNGRKSTFRMNKIRSIMPRLYNLPRIPRIKIKIIKKLLVITINLKSTKTRINSWITITIMTIHNYGKINIILMTWQVDMLTKLGIWMAQAILKMLKVIKIIVKKVKFRQMTAEIKILKVFKWRKLKILNNNQRKPNKKDWC